MRVFSGLDGSKLADYFALSADYRGGVRPMAVDTDGEGGLEIVLASMSNGRMHVRLIDGLAGTEREDLVYMPLSGSRVEFQALRAANGASANQATAVDPLSLVDAVFSDELWN